MLIKSAISELSQSSSLTTQPSQTVSPIQTNTSQLAEDIVQFTQSALANVAADDSVNIEMGPINLPPP